MLYLFEAVFKLKELIEKVRERVAETKEERLEFPVRSPLAAKYQQLESIQRKLDDQNEAIFNRELELGRVRNELVSATGILKRKEQYWKSSVLLFFACEIRIRCFAQNRKVVFV